VIKLLHDLSNFPLRLITLKKIKNTLKESTKKKTHKNIISQCQELQWKKTKNTLKESTTKKTHKNIISQCQEFQ